MQNIIIAVSESGTAQTRTFDYIVTVDGRGQSQEDALTRPDFPGARDGNAVSLSSAMAQSPGGKSYLPILGAGLFHLFLEAGWQEFGSKILQGGRLVINSSIPEVLQLPWEQLRLPGLENILGQSDNFSIITPSEELGWPFHIPARSGSRPLARALPGGRAPGIRARRERDAQNG